MSELRAAALGVANSSQLRISGALVVWGLSVDDSVAAGGVRNNHSRGSIQMARILTTARIQTSLNESILA